MPTLHLIAQYLLDYQIWWKYLKPRPNYVWFEHFQYGSFDLKIWPWPLKSNQWNLAAEMLNICTKFRKNDLHFSRNHNKCNQRTNEPNKLEW